MKIGKILKALLSILPFVLSYLQKKDKMPDWLQKPIALIGEEKLIEFIDTASNWPDKTETERRDWAVGMIRLYLKEHYGLDIPDSVLNLVAEYGVQLWKRRE
jgi:hypothetical protein